MLDDFKAWYLECRRPMAEMRSMITRCRPRSPPGGVCSRRECGGGNGREGYRLTGDYSPARCPPLLGGPPYPGNPCRVPPKSAGRQRAEGLPAAGILAVFLWKREGVGRRERGDWLSDSPVGVHPALPCDPVCVFGMAGGL